MRMSSAWAKLVLENNSLKVALLGITVIALSLTMLLFIATTKEPLLIERSCFSKSVQASGAQQTKEEIEAFLHLALSQRFDSDVNETESLDVDLSELRIKEQKDLDARQMKQFIHVNSISGERGTYQVDADRIVSVGKLRSALRFPLSLKISSVDRSKSNPYGLLLTDVDQLKDPKND